MPRIPPWITVRLPGDGHYYDVRKRIGALQLHTVCEEASCPNIGQCWGGGTATFMILGDVCTRGCRFCSVSSGRPPLGPDPSEPDRLADAAASMGLRYIVVTSVDRDDLADGGAQHFALVVRTAKSRLPGVTVELLTPDFSGDTDAIAVVGHSGADVVGHNLETVRSLTPSVRDRRCDYDQSLRVLGTFRALDPALLIKSSLMLGLGEQDDEVQQTLCDLRAVGVDWVTLGQYLRPTRKHLPVARYVPPETFTRWAEIARNMGFALATAGPLVRSSYRAAQSGALALIARRRQRSRSIEH